MARTLLGFRLSPLGMKEDHERRPCYMGDYTFSGVNLENLPLAAKLSMQFGRELE